MYRNILLTLTLLLSSVMGIIAHPSVPGSYIPRGTYLQSSRQIRVILYCQAQKINGGWIPSSYDLSVSGPVLLENMDGVLVGKSGTSSTFQLQLPGGSYTASCKDIRLILTAQCKKIDGTWSWSSLDITGGITGDIGNDNGRLVMHPG